MKKTYQAPMCKMTTVVNTGICQGSFPINDEKSDKDALGKVEIEGLTADDLWDTNEWLDLNEW